MSVMASSFSIQASLAAVPRGSTAVVVIDMQNDFCHPEGAMAQLGHDVSVNETILAPLSEFLTASRAAGPRIRTGPLPSCVRR